MLRYDRQTKTGLVALYDIRPGNGAGPFLQPRRPHGAVGLLVVTFLLELCKTYSSSCYHHFHYHHLHHPYISDNSQNGWRHYGTGYPTSTWKMVIKTEREKRHHNIIKCAKADYHLPPISQLITGCVVPCPCLKRRHEAAVRKQERSSCARRRETTPCG